MHGPVQNVVVYFPADHFLNHKGHEGARRKVEARRPSRNGACPERRRRGSFVVNCFPGAFRQTAALRRKSAVTMTVTSETYTRNRAAENADRLYSGFAPEMTCAMR